MPGIGPINAISFFAVAMINNIIFSLVHYMQPYVFEVQLGIPSSEQGVLVGNLTVMQELIVIAMTGVAGALADKYGRRPIFCGGTLLIGVAYALYPLAESASLLYVARAFLVWALRLHRLFCWFLPGTIHRKDLVVNGWAD